ncbi:MAG: methyltransferase domain-containing protein [Neisseriales bacterium]|nr:MAG: methyltransferase domain-containing protein [Neisseriales bacterium]
MKTKSSTSYHQFARWLEKNALGRYVLRQETDFFCRITADMFGFYAIQLGLSAHQLLRDCRLTHYARVDTSRFANIRSEIDLLPLPYHSIDLIVMPHTLDFSPDPLAVLREASQLLIPGGHMVLTGFNPLSLWGMRHFIHKRAGIVPWCGAFFSLRHLKDWLKLLGLTIELGRFMLYRLPFSSYVQHGRWLDPAGDRWWPTGAGIYGIRAVKQVYGAHRLMPKWRPVNFKPAVVAESKNSICINHPSDS